MANINTSLFLVTFLMGIVLCSCTRDLNLDDKKRGKMWCVAKVSATDAQMQAFLDANCGSLDCRQINPGETMECAMPISVLQQPPILLMGDANIHECNGMSSTRQGLGFS
ncbi:unnamed protein product [Fraxinus pennsylvanica]|uniref:X8 domain-containing protein n=1 Tax=Fraxinus pennsylvanica TaxID=56036 RepID=A0AAD1ZGC7_9LAMI|nr:unnamed protein product [Fraxinus pennsylvanica]